MKLLPFLALFCMILIFSCDNDPLSITNTEMNPNDSSLIDTDIDTTEIDTTEIDTTEIDTTEIDTTEIDTTEIDTTEIDTTEIEIDTVWEKAGSAHYLPEKSTKTVLYRKDDTLKYWFHAKAGVNYSFHDVSRADGGSMILRDSTGTEISRRTSGAWIGLETEIAGNYFIEFTLITAKERFLHTTILSYGDSPLTYFPITKRWISTDSAVILDISSYDIRYYNYSKAESKVDSLRADYALEDTAVGLIRYHKTEERIDTQSISFHGDSVVFIDGEKFLEYSAYIPHDSWTVIGNTEKNTVELDTPLDIYYPGIDTQYVQFEATQGKIYRTCSKGVRSFTIFAYDPAGKYLGRSSTSGYGTNVYIEWGAQSGGTYTFAFKSYNRGDHQIWVEEL